MTLLGLFIAAVVLGAFLVRSRRATFVQTRSSPWKYRCSFILASSVDPADLFKALLTAHPELEPEKFKKNVQGSECLVQIDYICCENVQNRLMVSVTARPEVSNVAVTRTRHHQGAKIIDITARLEQKRLTHAQDEEQSLKFRRRMRGVK